MNRVRIRTLAALWSSLIAISPVCGTARGQAPKSAKAAGPTVRLSAVIGAFLVDSGVRTRGLPWTTGNDVPVKWQSAKPVPNPDQSRRKLGITLARIGAVTTPVAGVALPVEVTATGNELGLAQVTFTMPMQDVTREQIEKDLRESGMTLQPLKCSRETEGASFGNLLDAAKIPGRTASGLWWLWNCAHDGCTLVLTLLYRKADAAQVECYSG